MLEAAATSRVPELVPFRHGRMLVSPFTYRRGAADMMAIDIGRLPVSGLRVQAYGDAPVGNFGEFATPERNIVFDINDFDETLPASWEWDVQRAGDPTIMDLNNLSHYAGLCAWALAHAHARTGDAVAISGYLGTNDRFDRAIAEFAVRYGDQTEIDHAALQEAARSGRIEARLDTLVAA